MFLEYFKSIIIANPPQVHVLCACFVMLYNEIEVLDLFAYGEWGYFNDC